MQPYTLHGSAGPVQVFASPTQLPLLHDSAVVQAF